ncbi:MAG: hypothetical protein ACRCSI_07060 [Eubacterium aggregans]
MSADEEFKKLIRSMYRFLKAFHHSYVLQVSADQNRQPIRLTDLAHQLATSVRPALPSLNTEWLIYGNARNWLHTWVDILRDHYKGALDEAKAELRASSRVRWEEAWQVATSKSENDSRSGNSGSSSGNDKTDDWGSPREGG